MSLTNCPLLRFASNTHILTLIRKLLSVYIPHSCIVTIKVIPSTDFFHIHTPWLLHSGYRRLSENSEINLTHEGAGKEPGEQYGFDSLVPLTYGYEEGNNK